LSISATIKAHVQRDVETTDIAGTFMKADMVEGVYVKLDVVPSVIDYL